MIIQIGDKVRVVDHGKQYSTYRKWAEANGMQDYAYNESFWENGADGVVVAVGPHLDAPQKTLVGVRIRNSTYIFGAEGLTVVERSVAELTIGEAAKRLKELQAATVTAAEKVSAAQSEFNKTREALAEFQASLRLQGLYV